jgi:transcription termination/antitermination protein NusG
MNETPEDMTSSDLASSEEEEAVTSPAEETFEGEVQEAAAQADLVDLATEEALAETVQEAADEANLLDTATDEALAETVEGAAEETSTPEEFEAAMEEAEAEAGAIHQANEEVFEERVAEAAEAAERIEAANEEVFEERVMEAAEEAEEESEAGGEAVAEAEAIAKAAAESPEEARPDHAAVEEGLETTVKDPFKGPGDWYVVHTYAGYENKVKTNLESRIHTMQMEDKIFDVHIPMEDVMEIKGGKKQVVQRKVFPGYLLVKMTYDNDSWYVVRNTPGVTGFVAAGTGSKPTPLSRREVEKIVAVKKQEVKPTFRLGFEEGDVVRIVSGPFADFNGTISEINVDQSKLKVLVNIFDRETPVELGFDQVAKV